MIHRNLDLTGDDQPFTRPVTFTAITCPYCRANTHRIQQMGLPPTLAKHFKPKGYPCTQGWNPGIIRAHFGPDADRINTSTGEIV